MYPVNDLITRLRKSFKILALLIACYKYDKEAVFSSFLPSLKIYFPYAIGK
jgi:hypothetical protein